MNYRHAFHAGNFADVLKHVVLSRVIEYLKRKDKAFRVIDTHAGSGMYDLRSDTAARTGEWIDGIGRLGAARLPTEVADLMRPYTEAVSAANGGEGHYHLYPGSPTVTRHLLRKQDRLTAIELHPEEHVRLKALFEGDYQVKVIELDGWLALGAQVPPKEKRGLVLVDPPFEEPGEFDRLGEGLVRAINRWPGGIYALWYPIKDLDAVAAFRDGLRQAGIPKILDIWLNVRGVGPEARLVGSGLVVVNPPFSLETEMQQLLPALCAVLRRDAGATWGAEWLAGEDGSA